MFVNSLRNKIFLKKFFILVLPIALQEFLIASLGIIDTMMIGKTGGANMAAVNLANQPFFIFFLLLMAITSGASVFTAQYWGNRDIKGVSRAFGLSFFGSIFVATITSLISFFFAEDILAFYSKDVMLIKQGALYLKIISVSYIFTAATVSLSALLRSSKQPKIPLVVSMGTIVLNTILNYILIFGKFGAPEMGVAGAAIATITSRSLETIVLYSILYFTNNPIMPKFAYLADWKPEFLKSYGKICIPVLINDVGWVTGFSLYNKVYAGIGTDAITAITIMGSMAYLFLVLFFGTGHAAAAILGNQLGQNKLEESKQDAESILEIIVILTLFVSIIMASLSSLIPQFYNVSDSIKHSATMLIIIFSLALPFKVINMNIIAGILRSGGDTAFSAALDIGAVWLIGVPIAFFTAFYLHFSIEAVFAFVMIEEVVKSILAIYRMFSGKWIKRVI